MHAKIMIVDDAMFMRNKIKKILEECGFEEIVDCANGKEAVETYKTFRPDLVTMDIVMPDMDGITALNLIRSFDPEAKVVMITAMGQQSLVVDAIRCGAMDFITKPFMEEQVRETVCSLLEELPATGGDSRG